MTPLFGMLFGALLYAAEPIEAGFSIGAIPVLAGIVLVRAGPWSGQTLRNTRKRHQARSGGGGRARESLSFWFCDGEPVETCLTLLQSG